MDVERFVELAKEEGIHNEPRVRQLWDDRPRMKGTDVRVDPEDEGQLREVFRHFKGALNRGDK